MWSDLYSILRTIVLDEVCNARGCVLFYLRVLIIKEWDELLEHALFTRQCLKSPWSIGWEELMGWTFYGNVLLLEHNPARARAAFDLRSSFSANNKLINVSIPCSFIIAFWLSTNIKGHLFDILTFWHVSPPRYLLLSCATRQRISRLRDSTTGSAFLGSAAILNNVVIADDSRTAFWFWTVLIIANTVLKDSIRNSLSSLRILSTSGFSPSLASISARLVALKIFVKPCCHTVNYTYQIWKVSLKV